MSRLPFLLYALLSAGILLAPLCPIGQAFAQAIAQADKSSDSALPLEPMPEPVGQATSRQGAMLKGGAESDILKGSAEHNELSGNAEQNALQPQSARRDRQPVLKGFASTQAGGISADDPDVGDRELEIQWDRWRNKFLRAVLASVQQKINDPDSDYYVRPRRDPTTGGIMAPYPMGTIAWFTVQVTRDGAIKNLSILQTSGYDTYDKCVLQAIHELEGSSILRYPSRSRRALVQQEGGIKTAAQGGYTDHVFGDVERYKEPAW